MPVMSPKVFIILLNWNNWNETKECLESLENVDYPNFQVVVVDNDSDERPPLSSFRKEGTLSGVGMILNNSNLGFAGGNNVGITYALEQRADYILLLNNDAVVAPDFLSKLVRAAESDKNFGILGSRIYKYKTNEVVFDGGRVNFLLTKGEHSQFQIPDSLFRTVDYITGAALLIKREVVEKIGLMRKEYFLYYEDVDWCIRARRARYKCALVPKSKVWHKVSATNKEGSPSYIYYHTRNALMLAKFNGSILQKATAYIVGAWILLKQITKFFFLPSKRIWARAMTRGVLDFYRGKYGKYAYRH